MKKIILATLLLVFTFTIYTQANAQSSETMEFFNITSANKKISDLDKDIDKLTQKLYQLDDEKLSDNENDSEKYKEVRKEIVGVIQDINNTTEHVSKTLKRIANYKKQISKLNNQLKKTRQNISDTKEYIQDFAVFMYKMENEISDKNGDIDTFKLLVKSDDISSTMVNKEIIEKMMTEINNILESLEVDEERYLELIKKINRLKQDSLKDIEDYNVMLGKLNQKKNYLAKFIQLYQENALQEEKFKVIFDSKKELHFAIIDMVSNVSLGRYETDFDMKEKLEELSNIKTSDKEQHLLGWPMYPINNIETFFKDSDFEKNYGVPQLGIQINTIQGTPVYSAKEGVVYHVSDTEGFGINWLLIAHSDGYVSTYVYLNDIIVKPGDIVRKGELIGYSGGEPGTDGAGFISQGPNLTFMIFKKGIALDPITVLDLSILKSKNDIPKDYKIKYLNDKYSRTIDVSDIKFMEGKTQDQRSQAFLNKYSVGEYRNLGLWDRAVKGNYIDRDVLICIGFAESTLGQYLATDNNIGNVGNDDSGNRRGFSSPVIGAMAIANTLNNQHLGHYHTILQLSRYGNDDGMIYASSPINRQTNMTKCLSTIKGYYVPEDYPFRTGPNPNR